MKILAEHFQEKTSVITNKYLSKENSAILSSKNGDTLEDLVEFIEKLESKRINRWRCKYGKKI